MALVVPLNVMLPLQTQVYFMYQGRRLQGMAAALAPQIGRCHTSQLGVDGRGRLIRNDWQ
jgi:hypothetical protein